MPDRESQEDLVEIALFPKRGVGLFRRQPPKDPCAVVPEGWVVLSGEDTQTECMWSLPVPSWVVSEYVAALRAVPPTVSSWSRDALRDVLEETDPEDHDALRRMLVIFASHGDAWACSVLGDLMHQSPKDLRGFAEVAYAQGMARLGWSYTRIWPNRSGVVYTRSSAESHGGPKKRET